MISAEKMEAYPYQVQKHIPRFLVIKKFFIPNAYCLQHRQSIVSNPDLLDVFFKPVKVS